MSLDRSLKVQSGLTRSRNVLTRSERLTVLKDEERWDESKSVFGLPKVRQRKQSSAGKKEAKAPAAEGAATGAAAPSAAAPAADASKTKAKK
jgi:small basic protein (TIGR04137 family)